MEVSDLRKYKDSLYTALSRDLSEFEKNFLLIASGVLAFSITFVKDIVTIEDAIYLWLLFSSWFLFSFAVGLMMFTFLLSASCSDKLWKCVDDYLLEKNKLDGSQVLTIEEAGEIKSLTNTIFYASKKKLKNYRYTSISLFIVATIFFSAFISINISKENRNTIKNLNSITIHIDSIKIKVNDTLIISK